MAKQPIHIEAAVSTAVGAVQGGALGGLMGSLTADGESLFLVPQPPPNANPQAMASFKQAQLSGVLFPKVLSLVMLLHMSIFLLLKGYRKVLKENWLVQTVLRILLFLR